MVSENKKTSRTEYELLRAYSIIVCEFESLEKIYFNLQAARIEYSNGHYIDKFEARMAINNYIILFFVRSRNLLNFFRNDCKKARVDDIKLTDFGLDYSMFSDCQEMNIVEVVERINKEISHLTYQQVKSIEERSWDFGAIYDRIKDRYQVFIHNMQIERPDIVYKSVFLDTLAWTSMGQL